MSGKNNCEILGMSDACEIPYIMARCYGIADVNGDGKDDHVLTKEAVSMNKDGYTTEIIPPDVIYNGTNLGVKRSDAQRIEELKSIDFFNSSGSASFRMNERVLFEGSIYVVKVFVPVATCDEKGGLVFSRSDTTVFLVPKEIADQDDSIREESNLIMKKINALEAKAQRVEGEDLEKLRNDAKPLVERFNALQEALANVINRMEEAKFEVKLDEIKKIK